MPTAASRLDELQQRGVTDLWMVESDVDAYNETGNTRQPQLQATSSLDPQHRSFIDTFHRIEMSNQEYRLQYKGKGKGKGVDTPGSSAPVSELDSVPEFDGDVDQCPLCITDFIGGDSVMRLVCRHVFHTECWRNYETSTRLTLMRCPVCRGSSRIAARYTFIAPPRTAATPPPPAPAETPHSPEPASSSSFRSASSTIQPWNPAPGNQPSGYFHASTQLPNNQLSLLVDIGQL